MDEINQSRLAQLAEMSGLDKVSPLILCAPNTLLDPKSRGSTGQIPVAVLKYFKKNVVKSPWLNQLLLVVLIHIARNLEPSSIYSLVSLLHKRFAGFSRARATRFDDMKVFNDNVDETMRLYLSGVVLQADTKATRSGFYIFHSYWPGRHMLCIFTCLIIAEFSVIKKQAAKPRWMPLCQSIPKCDAKCICDSIKLRD
jgi:hypothetical protein